MINTLITSSNNQLVDYLEDIINSSIKTKITTCNNGYESLTYIQESKPDLMIVDIDLNDINGIELFQEFRKKILPVIKYFIQINMKSTLK